MHRLLDFLVHFKAPLAVAPLSHAAPLPSAARDAAGVQDAEHSPGSIVDKLCDANLLLAGSVNDAALTKLLRLGYIRDVLVQEWRGAASPHTL